MFLKDNLNSEYNGVLCVDVQDCVQTQGKDSKNHLVPGFMEYVYTPARARNICLIGGSDGGNAPAKNALTKLESSYRNDGFELDGFINSSSKIGCTVSELLSDSRREVFALCGDNVENELRNAGITITDDMNSARIVVISINSNLTDKTAKDLAKYLKENPEAKIIDTSTNEFSRDPDVEFKFLRDFYARVTSYYGSETWINQIVAETGKTKLDSGIFNEIATWANERYDKIPKGSIGDAANDAYSVSSVRGGLRYDAALITEQFGQDMRDLTKDMQERTIFVADWSDKSAEKINKFLDVVSGKAS